MTLNKGQCTILCILSNHLEQTPTDPGRTQMCGNTHGPETRLIAAWAYRWFPKAQIWGNPFPVSRGCGKSCGKVCGKAVGRLRPIFPYRNRPALTYPSRTPTGTLPVFLFLLFFLFLFLILTLTLFLLLLLSQKIN